MKIFIRVTFVYVYVIFTDVYKWFLYMTLLLIVVLRIIDFSFGEFTSNGLLT